MKKILFKTRFAVGFVLVVVLFSTGVSSTVLSISVVHAASDTYTLLAPLPCIQGGGITCTNGSGSIQTQLDFQTYVQYAFNLAIAIAAVAAVFMLVWGGFEYMTSAAFSTKEAGKKKMTHSILGLVLILCSYIILKAINPNFVNISSTLVPPLQLATSTTQGVTGSYLGALQGTSYGDTANQQTQQWAQEEASISTLQAQLAQATAANAPAAQIANIQSQLNAAMGDATVYQSESAMNKVLADTLGATAPSTQVLQEDINTATQDYQDATAQLQNENATPTQQSALNSQFSFVDDELNFQVLSDYSPGNSGISVSQAQDNLNQIQTMAQRDGPTIPATQKAQFNIDAQAAEQRLQTYIDFNKNIAPIQMP